MWVFIPKKICVFITALVLACQAMCLILSYFSFICNPASCDILKNFVFKHIHSADMFNSFIVSVRTSTS